MKSKLLGGLLLAIVMVTAFSCKKDSDTPNSYVKIKKNGTWVTYNGLGELGPDLGDPTKTNLGVSATNSNQSETFDFVIQLNGTSFPTGTYTSGSLFPNIIMSLILNANTASLVYHDINDAPGRAPSQYSITITSITDTYLSGTFTGNYLSDGGTEVVEVTEGEFHVKRVR